METLKDDARKGLSNYDRFKFVPLYDNATASWVFEDKNSFEDDSLFSDVSVSNEAELLEELDRISMDDLTGYGKTPAWHIRRVVNTGDGLSAVAIRIHHVIGDGIALV